jgi:cysteine sulfinate desulfinase/cysteine desulfurase-like protein
MLYAYGAFLAKPPFHTDAVQTVGKILYVLNL